MAITLTERAAAEVKRIIEEHGGKVGFTSTRGLGSEVSLYLPVEEVGG